MAWGDYDTDGDLDILLTGTSGGSVSQVYRNDDCSPDLGIVKRASPATDVTYRGVVTYTVVMSNTDRRGGRSGRLPDRHPAGRGGVRPLGGAERRE